MKRILRKTADGSLTFFHEELNEPYHSLNGAIQESSHVFIRNGLQACLKKDIRILEIGFGTGLNMLLTYIETEHQKRNVYYHGVEKYPLMPEEYNMLNYCLILGDINKDTFFAAHHADWNMEIVVSDHFKLYKELSDFREMDPGEGYDLIYFDAFAPAKQPELWSKEIFIKLFDLMNDQGIWVSYTARGSVKRSLQSAGFNIEKLPGPPGKREMIRAQKI